MVTDDERRDVARRLRGQAKKLGPNMDAHEFAHYTADVIDVNECMTWYEMELRLADLVEPGEPKVRCVAEVKIDGEQLEKLAHDAAVKLTGIDRDALLAVAETLEDCAGRGSELTALGYSCLAKRIREALGVTADANA